MGLGSCYGGQTVSPFSSCLKCECLGLLVTVSQYFCSLVIVSNFISYTQCLALWLTNSTAIH